MLHKLPVNVSFLRMLVQLSLIAQIASNPLPKKFQELIKNPNLAASPILRAIINDDSEGVSQSLPGCSDINEVLDGDYTALIAASYLERLSIIQILISAGADPNGQTIQSGITPIHTVALTGNEDVLRILLQAGACLNGHKYPALLLVQDTPALALLLRYGSFIANPPALRLLMEQTKKRLNSLDLYMYGLLRLLSMQKAKEMLLVIKKELQWRHSQYRQEEDKLRHHVVGFCLSGLEIPSAVCELVWEYYAGIDSAVVMLAAFDSSEHYPGREFGLSVVVGEKLMLSKDPTLSSIVERNVCSVKDMKEKLTLMLATTRAHAGVTRRI